MSRFKVEKGRVEPADDPARQALRARSGDYLLAPSSPDLLLLYRARPSGGTLPRPKVVLAGDAAGFPLSDLIAFLSQLRWTGAVQVNAACGERLLHLAEGEVRSASSDNPAERLGELMVRLGYVARAQLEQTLEENPPSRLGKALVEKGIVQPHELWKCITHQVSEIFHAVVLCKEGTFLLLDEVPEEKGAQNVQVSMQSLLMDSIRKVDELAHFRKRIPHGRMHVVRKQPSDGRLEAEEDQVLSWCDGQRTVLALGSLARLGEFDITRIVYRLLEGGYAQVSERPLPPPPDAGAPAPAPVLTQAQPLPPSRDPAQVVGIFNQVFGEIRAEVDKQQMGTELTAAANAAICGSGLTDSPALEGLLFDGEGRLPVGPLLQQFDQVKAQLGSEPLASLRRALSDMMFFLLFQAGELLESRQDEALARRVKELLAPLEEG